MKGFSILYLHYVTEEFKLRSWTLEVMELPGIHTGTIIAGKLREVMNAWGLCRENCTRFGHDSGSNMVNAAEHLYFGNTPCLAHELHLVVLLDLEKNSMETMQGIVQSFSIIIGLHSEGGRVEFKDVWNKLSKPKHKEW
ncbi:Zinc finger BED domain-containing hypothetical protein [Phytophthora megakarya]|uniref:Uncharacterized protein n=1 Tax=Phytophthora megakarya TaxID=4795 RepID=A0A225V5N0_9STRA|nr:Zinc finger BED domain-containing hypothetical protein [Phytophthora megakarya]